jgi:serine/threonine protein kinase
MVGETIRDRYEVVAEIGEGGMGVVYKAIDKELQRPVALKMLHHAHSNDEMWKARFEKEAKALAKLNHPSIVTLYDFFKMEDKHFLVMELLEGKTGKELLEETGAIPFPELIQMFRRVIRALAHAHRNKIIHRDIKPNNIMITNSGEVKIMDFGIARTKDSPHMTQVGYTLGSVLYMSPEQIRNPQDVDERSDIYSLGITMFEMATGKPPFMDPDSSQPDILIKHLSVEPPSPRAINPDVPETLERAIIKALQKNPEDRFQTMEEFGSALALDTEEVGPALASDDDAKTIRLVLPPIPPSPKVRDQYFPRRPSGATISSYLNRRSLFLIVIIFVVLALIGTLVVRWYSELQPPGGQVAKLNNDAAPGHKMPLGQPELPGTKQTSMSEPIPVESTLPKPPTPVRIAKFKAIYLTKGKGPLELKEADTLTSKDRYYFVFSPDEELYVYVAQVDSAGVIDSIFPSPKYGSRNNPLAPDTEYRFPEKEYFFLGGGPGKEHLYLIASRGPNEKLEDIYKELPSADALRIKQLARDFIEIFSQQEPNNVRELWFWHR